jgi:hypothetical protein
MPTADRSKERQNLLGPQKQSAEKQLDRLRTLITEEANPHPERPTGEPKPLKTHRAPPLAAENEAGNASPAR